VLTSLIALVWLGAPANGLEEALARPLSPGAVGLLLEHGHDVRARDRIALALRDANPATRAMAARVVNVAPLESLTAQVADALASEPTTLAAEEQARALLTLDAKADDRVLEATRRLGGPLGERLGIAFAAARAAGALAQLDTFRSAGLPDGSLARFLELGGRDEPAKLGTVAQAALRGRDAALWEALLVAARRLVTDLDVGLVAQALEVDDAVRARTLESLALVASKEARPKAVAQAIDAIRAATAREPRPLALELINRADRRPPVDETKALATAADETLPFLRLVLASGVPRALLSKEERSALRTRLGIPAGMPERYEDIVRVKVAPSSRPSVRLATAYPPGFIASLIEASGCVPNDKWLLAGEVTRDKFGRPTKVGVYDDWAGGPDCVAAAHALIATHLGAPLEVPEATRELLALPPDPELLACLGAPEPAPEPRTAARPVGGEIKEPRKTRNVAPRYPDSAKADRVSGVVVLEATISVTGCIRELRVVSGVDLRLDLSALRAVAAWQYTPTLLDGIPTPVIMTVTINFKLS
jgi:TonB family protein